MQEVAMREVPLTAPQGAALCKHSPRLKGSSTPGGGGPEEGGKTSEGISLPGRLRTER
jgi:hypothetical protein